MKKILFLTVLFLLNHSYSQKKYSFDYALVYNFTSSKQKNTLQFLYFVNSKDNSYFQTAQLKDSLNFEIRLVDQRGVMVHSSLPKNDFYRSETINNSCKYVSNYESLGKNKINDYYYQVEKDTLINDTLYSHYILKSNKGINYTKRKNIPTAHFIVEKTSRDFIPFLPQSIMYEEWISNAKIPFGLAKMIYFTNPDGTWFSTYQLVSSLKSNRFATIPNECDYTVDEIRKDHKKRL